MDHRVMPGGDEVRVRGAADVPAPDQRMQINVPLGPGTAA